jgi:hypothetical protein
MTNGRVTYTLSRTGAEGVQVVRIMLEEIRFDVSLGFTVEGLSSTDTSRIWLEKVPVRNAWTYYAGNGSWFSQIADAVSVLTANNISSISSAICCCLCAPLSLDVL